jgi:hypothetical protein
MTLRLVIRLAGLAACSIGVAASAQQAPPPPDPNQIVVEGRRDRDEEIKDLIQALPPTGGVDGHLSRFEMAACPGVVGLPEEQKVRTVERMRAVAQAAGVPLGKPGCRVNVLLMITADKAKLMEHLAAHYPGYLGDVSNRRMAALAKAPTPSALWHLKTIVDADGREEFAAGLQEVVARRTGRGASRITDLAHPSFSGSILVVEAAALPGLSTTQLADYAAMRTLSGADPARLPDRHARTILTVLDAPNGAEVPITLTEWDLSFLKSLYASDPDRFATSQRGEIQNRMRKELATGQSGEEPR